MWVLKLQMQLNNQREPLKAQNVQVLPPPTPLPPPGVGV